MLQSSEIYVASGLLFPPSNILLASSTGGEEVCHLTSNFKVISCETKTFRNVSPSVEPYIPERV